MCSIVTLRHLDETELRALFLGIIYEKTHVDSTQTRSPRRVPAVKVSGNQLLPQLPLGLQKIAGDF